MTDYAIRDAQGVLRAIHVRHDTPDGKRMSWRGAEGSTGLDGLPVAELPLYGSERVTGWEIDTWIVVTEGESDCDALTRCGIPALAKVTGAATVPAVNTLRDVARGRRFLLWPDNDHAGRAHMAALAVNLYRAGASVVRSLAYVSEVAAWPKGAGARDLVGDEDPAVGQLVAGWLLEEWSLPVDRPRTLEATRRPAPSRDMTDTGSVSAALIARGVLNAKPGRTVRCPAHEDRHASLSVLRDDLRAICKSESCPWAGRGVIARDVLAVPA